MRIKLTMLILLCGVNISSIETMNWSPYGINKENVVITYSDGSVFCSFFTSVPQLWIYRNELIEEDGFLRINDQFNDQTDRVYVLEGKNVILFEEYYYPYDWSIKAISPISTYNSPMIYRDLSIETWHKKKYSNENQLQIKQKGHVEWGKVFIFEDGLKHLSSSSFLNETQKDGTVISYNSSNIRDSLFFLTGDGTLDLLYDNKTPPWVEGVEGYGIGEYLEIEFKYASDEMQILNGFVDFSRMHLYKDNSRVKRILIESEEPAFSKEYELEDVVRYNVLTLPSKTTKIRMTILDVYPGRKWQDTCISSILVTDPNQPPYEEQKKKIIALMKDNGVWEKIEEFKKQLRNEAK